LEVRGTLKKGIIKLYFRGKLVKEDGKDVDATDQTALTNNLLHSLFSQCNVAIAYHTSQLTTSMPLLSPDYPEYPEGTGAAASQLTNAFLYLDNGDLLPCNPSAAIAKSKGFVTRWNRIKQSK
jgi:hypothetical protein